MAAAPTQQIGIFLRGGALGAAPGAPRHELELPAPPPAPAALDPAAYAALLPGAGELTTTVVPVTTKLGNGGTIVVVHGRRRLAPVEQNQQATVLTASLQTGFGAEIFGPALVLFARPGADLTMHYFNCLDDLIRNVVFDCFEEGEVPTDSNWEEWAQLLELQLEARFQDGEGDEED